MRGITRFYWLRESHHDCIDYRGDQMRLNYSRACAVDSTVSSVPRGTPCEFGEMHMSVGVLAANRQLECII